MIKTQGPYPCCLVVGVEDSIIHDDNTGVLCRTLLTMCIVLAHLTCQLGGHQ